MKLHVFDTDIVSLLLRGQSEVVQRVAKNSEDLAVSIITAEEMLAGWYAQIRRAKSDEQFERAYRSLQESIGFLGQIRVLPFDIQAIQQFREFKRHYSRTGSIDLKIAAIVVRNDAVLVTRNRRDFEQIAGIELEDWSVPP